MNKNVAAYKVTQFEKYDGYSMKTNFEKKSNYSTYHDGMIDRQIKIRIPGFSRAK